eukprot:scaffold6297_cov79-Phaeocystis_antarctica.AAC.3
MEMMPATNDKDPAHSTAVGARLCAELQGMLASCTDRAVEPPAKLAEMLGDFLNAEASAAFKALQPQVAPQEWLIGLSWSVCRVRLE